MQFHIKPLILFAVSCTNKMTVSGPNLKARDVNGKTVIKSAQWHFTNTVQHENSIDNLNDRNCD
jgi:hypothetical protein